MPSILTLPERSETTLHLSRLFLCYLGGMAAILVAVLITNITVPQYWYQVYQTGNNIVGLLLAWIWIRPLASLVYYSLLYRRPTRGLIQYTDLTWVMTYGMVGTAVTYHLLRHWKPLAHYITAHPVNTITLWFSLAVIGAVLATLIRTIYFKIADNTYGPSDTHDSRFRAAPKPAGTLDRREAAFPEPYEPLKVPRFNA